MAEYALQRDLVSLNAVTVPPKGVIVELAGSPVLWHLRGNPQLKETKSSHCSNLKVARIHSSKGLNHTPGPLWSKPVCITIHEGDDCQVSTHRLSQSWQKNNLERWRKTKSYDIICCSIFSLGKTHMAHGKDKTGEWKVHVGLCIRNGQGFEKKKKKSDTGLSEDTQRETQADKPED